MYDKGDDDKTKYQQIMDRALEQLKKNPGYKLYVTGHSLGAALASLFAFMVSASEEYWDVVPSPVTCVSIASPYVGGSNFLEAFQELERLGRLRYLRVANQGDLVSIEPFFTINLGFYKHCGMELKLKQFGAEGDACSLMYPKGENTLGNSLMNNLTIRPITNHSPKEYGRRLELAKSELENTQLEDMYQQQRF